MYDEKQYKEYGDNYYYYDKVLGWAGHVCDTPPQQTPIPTKMPNMKQK